MPDYRQGKIYAIRSHQTDEVYIGSTSQKLAMRMCGHRADFKRGFRLCTSQKILRFGDAYIELVEDCPCDNKNQLRRREGQIIRETNCVNKVIAGRTRKEYYEEESEKIKEYYQNNKERLQQYRRDNVDKKEKYDIQYRKDNRLKKKENDKLYYEKNKAEISVYVKQWRTDNKDILKLKKAAYYQKHKNNINAKHAIFYQNNKEKIKKNVQVWRSKKIECSCGSSIQRGSKLNHLKTKKHKDRQALL